MENILKIIYDKSLINKLLDFNDIEKVLELLIINNELNEYILNINVQSIRSNNLASYSAYDKSITIYSGMIEFMIQNIEKNILLTNDFEKMLYKNLSLLQIILHEVEHANQIKIAYTNNSLEALIIRMTYLTNYSSQKSLYECCPTERFAEIKSYKEIQLLVSYIDKKLIRLQKTIESDELQRLLKGYHYKNTNVESPLINYFKLSKKEQILNYFDWYSKKKQETLNSVSSNYNLNDRLKYGFPIDTNEYSSCMKKLVLSLNEDFINRTNYKFK